MIAIVLLVHRIAVSIFVLSYVLRLIGLLGNIAPIQQLYAKKAMRIVIDMVVSTVFLVTGVYMLVVLPEEQISMLILVKISLVVVSIPIAVIGFRRNKKILALLSVLLILGTYGLGEMNRRRPPVDKKVLEAATNPQDIFKASNCQTCHGADGKAMIAGAKDLSISKLTDAELKHTIMNGRNAMPAYKKQLDDEKLNALVEYVKSLRK